MQTHKHGSEPNTTVEVPKERKVLIVCPTLGLDPDPDKWLNSLLIIMNNCRREGFTHALFAPFRQQWWPANNLIWDCAFANNFDYILRIDDDIHGAPMDCFSKLLNADKVVIGAAYPNRRYPYTVQAMVRAEDKPLPEIYQKNLPLLQSVQWHGYTGENVQEVELIGFGMTLIKVKPFKFMDRPMYKGEENCPDDTYFAQVCLENGIKQYVHWGVRIKHAHVTFENSGHLYNADVLQAHPELSEKSPNVYLAEALKPPTEEEINAQNSEPAKV